MMRLVAAIEIHADGTARTTPSSTLMSSVFFLLLDPSLMCTGEQTGPPFQWWEKINAAMMFPVISDMIISQLTPGRHAQVPTSHQ